MPEAYRDIVSGAGRAKDVRISTRERGDSNTSGTERKMIMNNAAARGAA